MQLLKVKVINPHASILTSGYGKFVSEKRSEQTFGTSSQWETTSPTTAGVNIMQAAQVLALKQESRIPGQWSNPGV